MADALVSRPAVAEAAAVASPHDDRGNAVEVYAVLAAAGSVRGAAAGGIQTGRTTATDRTTRTRRY